MWRPRQVGSIIAERKLKFAEPRQRARIVSIKFGRPYRPV